MTKPAITKSKLGGTRIPYNKVDTLPLVKINELVAIYKDGSVRYFSIGAPIAAKLKPDVVAVIYNGMSGKRLPIVEVSDVFRFESRFHRALMSLRYVASRYVERAQFTVSIYRFSDASTIQRVGIFKTLPGMELGLRAFV